MTNINELYTEIVRQGDILLKVIDKAKLKDAKQIVRNGIIEEGEATNHFHRLPDKNSKFYETNNGQLLVEVTEASQITHEDHLPVNTVPETYEVIREREFDYGTYVDRIVRD